MLYFSDDLYLLKLDKGGPGLCYRMREFSLGAGEMAQWFKYLLHKHETQSWLSSAHVDAG